MTPSATRGQRTATRGLSNLLPVQSSPVPACTEQNGHQRSVQSSPGPVVSRPGMHRTNSVTRRSLCRPRWCTLTPRPGQNPAVASSGALVHFGARASKPPGGLAKSSHSHPQNSAPTHPSASSLRSANSSRLTEPHHHSFPKNKTAPSSPGAVRKICLEPPLISGNKARRSTAR